MSKQLIIKIGENDLSVLKDSKYLLCIAKTIDGEAYDIVWRAFDTYFANNSFSWTPDYTLLMTNQFTSGEKLFPNSQSKPINIGQQTTLNNAGTFGPSITGQYPDSFEMINECGNIYAGINQSSIGIDDKKIISPNYISQTSNVPGPILLKPVDELLVWFQQGVETSTMFSVSPMLQPTNSFAPASSQSFAYEVDMTNSNNMTINYENNKWSTLS